MSLESLLDEAFPALKAETPTAPPVAKTTGGGVNALVDEAFGDAPAPQPEPPGFLSRAASAVTSAVTGLLPGGPTVGFKAAGPAIAPDAATPPKSMALPQVPSDEDLKATRSSAAIPEPKAPAPPPVPIKIGPVAGFGPAVEEVRRAPLLEQVGGPQRSEVFKSEPVKPAGMLARGAAAAGVVNPEAADQRRMEAEFAATSVMRKPEGMSEERWQVRQALETLNRTTAALPRATADRLTFGMLPALLDTFGIESPKTRAPRSQPEALAAGAGELAGFILGPARASHAMLESNILKWIGPKAGDAVGTILAKNVATQAANLGVASGIAHLGEEAQADTLADAYREMGQHVKGGAMLGAAFGVTGGVIPGNQLLPRAARLGVGLTAIDAAQGTRLLDERVLSQKAFDYGLNIAFLWRGQDPRAMKQLLEAEAKARNTTPEGLLKSVLDKAMERAAKATPEDRTTLEADLKNLFAQEVGDVATGTTATELRSARDVAEQKTGGTIEARIRLVPPAPRPTPLLGPPVILGPTGRPLERPETPAPEPGAMPTAQELAAARARGIVSPEVPAPQPAPAAAPVKAEIGGATKLGDLTFRDYVQAAGRKWPLTSRDPDFARLRFEFDDLRKGLYEAKPGIGGQWVIVNRKTGEEVDHLVGGAKAQLEANRLNAVVTLDKWREAGLPTGAPHAPAAQQTAPVEFQGLQETGRGKPPMELWGLTQDIPGYPKGSTVGRSTLEALGFTVPRIPAGAQIGVRPSDLSAKKAPEPTVEGAAAAQQQAEQAILEGPKPSAEPPKDAPVQAPPPAAAAVGKSQDLRVPAGSRYRVKYELVDATDLIPSHDPKSFARDPRYPEGVQNRPYHSDKSEQAKVIRQSQDFEPDFLLSERPTSQGSPILAPDSNVVLSGNSRSMTMMRLAGTEAFRPYRERLRERAVQFGFRPEDIDRVPNPVLVRRLVGSDTTPEFYRRFAKEANESFTQALNPQAQAVSQGQAVKPETMEWIAGQVDALGETATLREFLRSGLDREIIRRFIQDGVFTERDLNRYIDPRTTQLNEDGKRLVERAVLGNAIPDPDLLNQIPSAVSAKIERSLGALAKIKGRGGEWDLGKDLEDAVRVVIEVQATGSGSVGGLRQQGSLLEGAGPSTKADTLADALLRLKPNEFRAAINRYADAAQRDVRGQETLGFARPASPAAAFREAFQGGPEPGPQRPRLRAAEESAQYSTAKPEGTPYDTPEVVALRAEQAAVPATDHYIQSRPAEREGLWRRVAAKLRQTTTDNVPVQQGKQIWIVMGPPAAGKSKVLVNRISAREGAAIIDSDIAKLEIPESGRGRYNGAVHQESVAIMERALVEAMEAGDNIVLPVVGKGWKTLADNYIAAARDHGYRINLRLMDLPVEEAARRAVSRVTEQVRRGGDVQFVDPGYVLEIGERPRENYARLVSEGRVDSNEAFSNDVPFGSTPRRLSDADLGITRPQDGQRGVLPPDGGISPGAEGPSSERVAGGRDRRLGRSLLGSEGGPTGVGPTERPAVTRPEAAPPPDYDLPPVSLAEAAEAGGARGMARTAGGIAMRLLRGVEEPAKSEELSVLADGATIYGKVKARKGATTADRDAAQMALFDLEETAKQPTETVGKTIRGEDAGAGVRTVQRFIDPIKDKGFVDLRGEKVESAQDLAVLGQTLRDPRYETLRVFYTKGNEVVGMEAVTSRLPGTAMFMEGPAKGSATELRERRSRWAYEVRERMRRLEADGYYLMHNHPSGRPEPSRADLDLTQDIASRVPGFKTHVVINSGQYGLIEMKPASEQRNTLIAVEAIKELPGRGRAKDDEFLSRVRHTITNPEQLAFFGKTLQVPENAVALIYRDSSGYVRAVQEMPRGLFMRPKEMADFLRGQQRAFGARDVMAWFKPDEATLKQAREYIASGVLMDAMAPGWAARESLKTTAPFARTLETTGIVRGIRVQEAGAPYGDFDRLPEETRRKLVEYGRGVLADGKTDFASWAKAIRDRVGEGVSGSLPGAWAALMQEAARTQRPMPGEQQAGGKPPAPPKDIPQSAKPLDPAPGLTEPQLKLGVHKDVLAAAEDLFKAGKLIRDPKMLLSDQILDAIREGKLRIEDMASTLDRHGMTFSEFGQSMFRPAITDAARRLAALSTLQKRIRDLEVELGGPEPPGGKKGGPGGKKGGPELEERIKTLGDLLDAAKAIDPAAVKALSWWRRADNIRRGLLVTQLATSVRNFSTQVGRLGIDVLDQGLQGALQRAFGKEVTAHPADSFRALMEALSQVRPSKHKAVRDRVDAILEGLPREQERLFNNYASDLTRAAKLQGAERAVDKVLTGGEQAVELLNTVNRFQEYVVRRSVFQAELAGRLRARGIDIEQAIKDPDMRRAIPVSDIRAAIQKALEITFAENPAYGSPGYHFVKWVNQTPGLTFMTPFPRFMVNSLKFFYEFSPLGFTKLLSKIERQKFRQGDMQTISRATLGMALLGTAYLIRSMQEDDTKWYEVRLPGMERTLDTRAYNPFAAYLFVADLIHRSAQGRLFGGGLTAEAVKTFFGANVRGGTGLQAVDQLVDGLRDIGDTRALTKYLQGAGGHLVAGLLTPLQQLTDVYAQFDPESQVVRDSKSEPFLGPIKQRFPSTVVEQLGGELPEPKASPTAAEPVKRESPGLRQVFGLTLGKEKNDLEKELDRLQIPYREVLPSQGDPRLDNILAKHMGAEAEEVGGRIVNSARYQRLGDIGKRLELKHYLSRLRKKAKVKALQDRDYREISQEVKAGTSKERLAEMAREERAGLR